MTHRRTSSPRNHRDVTAPRPDLCKFTTLSIYTPELPYCYWEFFPNKVWSSFNLHHSYISGKFSVYLRQCRKYLDKMGLDFSTDTNGGIFQSPAHGHQVVVGPTVSCTVGSLKNRSSIFWKVARQLISSVQSLSRVWLFVTPWTAARQTSLFITRSPPKPMSIESVMSSNHLILCRPLLLLPSILPSIRVFSNESALHIRWPKYWSFSFSISPSNGKI